MSKHSTVATTCGNTHVPGERSHASYGRLLDNTLVRYVVYRIFLCLEWSRVSGVLTVLVRSCCVLTSGALFFLGKSDLNQDNTETTGTVMYYIIDHFHGKVKICDSQCPPTGEYYTEYCTTAEYVLSLAILFFAAGQGRAIHASFRTTRGMHT